VIRAAVVVMTMIVVMMVMAMMIVIMHIFVVTVQDTDVDAIAGNHRLDTSYIIFGTSFERDQKAHALEADTPVQIARVIAEFNRISRRRWLKPQPAFGRGPHDDRVIVVQNQNSSIIELLITRQRNRKLNTAARRCAQTAPRQVCGRDHDNVDRATMLKIVQLP
jgi:ABC-type uncharacterized transport system permease subunit